MFCPQCAKPVTKGLKYCKSCGEQLVKEEVHDGSPGKMLDDILDTLFWFAMVGLGILIGLVAVLLSKNFEPGYVAMIVIAYLMTIFGVCFFLVRQVPKLIDAKLKAWSGSVETPAQLQLRAQTTGQLDEYREPAMSVTDHTTKTLDKVPMERN